MITRLLTAPIVIALLTLLCLTLWLLLWTPARAVQSPDAEVITAAEDPNTSRMESRTAAKASASANASSKSGKHGDDNCQASASSRAEAKSGDQRDVQEDKDHTEGSDCRAEAAARARAHSDDRHTD